MRPFTLNLIWIKCRDLIKISECHSQQELNIVSKSGTSPDVLSLPFFRFAGCPSTALPGPGCCWSSVKPGARVFPCCFSSVTLRWRGGRRDEALGSLWTCHTVPHIWTGKAYSKFLRLVRFCPSAGSMIALTTLGLAVQSIKGVVIYN